MRAKISAACAAILLATAMTPAYAQYRYYHHDDAGAAIAGGILGFAAGAVAAGAAANAAAPPPAPDPNWVAYCARKYRSFDPASGTYLAPDGQRYYCR